MDKTVMFKEYRNGGTFTKPGAIQFAELYYYEFYQYRMFSEFYITQILMVQTFTGDLTKTPQRGSLSKITLVLRELEKLYYYSKTPLNRRIYYNTIIRYNYAGSSALIGNLYLTLILKNGLPRHFGTNKVFDIDNIFNF